MKKVFLVLSLLVLTTQLNAKGIPQALRDASVLVDSGGDGTGSGVIFKNGKTSFVWTDAHVIPDPEISTVIDPKTGMPKVSVKFRDMYVVQHEEENGRKVGQTSYLAKVIRYSREHDIALLMVYKSSYGKSSVKFYDAVPKVGAKVWHVGSMHGQVGINSVAEGTVAFTGRIRSGFTSNEQNGVVYDQISGVAHPGSSGGGVFLADSNHCMGLVTEFLGRGSAGSYCITPSRRLIEFANKHDAKYAVDNLEAAPTMDAVSGPFMVDSFAVPKDFPKVDGDKQGPALFPFRIIFGR